MSEDQPSPDAPECEIALHGIGVSPGVAIGHVFRLVNDEEHITEREIGPAEISREISRFIDALDQTRRQIRELQRSLEAGIGHSDASIFDAHLLVLDDRAFLEDVIKTITDARRNAEAVVRKVSEKYAKALSDVKDDYLRERVIDVRDVARRIVRNLSGRKAGPLDDLREPSVVVATELTPSETASLRKDLALGFLTDLGSPTAHTAVMARAMGIPAIVGLHDFSTRVSTGDRVLMDGNKGLIWVNPTPERLREYGHVIEVRNTIQNELKQLRDQPAETSDGHRVILAANLETDADGDAVQEFGAEGVGLFRSEYLFLAKRSLPTEDEQAAVYGSVARRFAPAPVVIRTLDLGGDKFLSNMTYPAEMNPFMGWRAIRLCLAQPDVFRAQLRAILRASAQGNVRVMYPMITKAEEVREANEHLEACKDALRAEGQAFDENLQVGVMIETPSAALTAELIADYVSFFSIGTNDLIQYALAVDRVNERVAYLYEPTHPAILKLVRHTLEVGRTMGKGVSMCGEMAGNPVLAPLLVGMGFRELSVAPAAVPLVKDAIRNISLSQARELAVAAESARTAAEILAQCRELVGRVTPEILELVG